MSKNIKKVSVILTTFNGEKTLQNTLNSIFNQKGIDIDFELELIVIDDCSTDKTLEIVHQYNATVLSTGENSGGPNKGRNIGLKHATGDFICIADHDDSWKAHKIKSVLPYLEKAPIVTSGYTVIDDSKKQEIIRVNQSSDGFQFYEKNETFLTKLTKSHQGQNTYIGSIVYSRRLNNILFEEKYGVVDFDWVLRLFHNNSSIEISDSLYYRNVSSGNLSLNDSYRKKDFDYSLNFVEEYRSEFEKEVIISKKRIHGTMARYYYVMGNMKKARSYFLKSEMNLKTIAYYFTTFVGSKFVKKHFNVFG